ncbi:hypothetical protein CYMTET_22662 [Cymbomonas tetramitiformis]|uniref:Integrase catalytic domain-containing protein n=1 Tax=Cymbomonas tetramitiformis TaxID=36881 RepID=A0AAE0FZG8_9CHLO|nr:hypothetical protein CYMTET_22662 [Cymbomonas tetramitiformis]
MDFSNVFEEGPSPSYPVWHTEKEACLHAVETLQLAERVMEATLAFKSRGTYLDPEALGRPSMRGKKTAKTPTPQAGGKEPPSRRITRSQTQNMTVEQSTQDSIATHGGGVNSLNNKEAVGEICEISDRKLAWKKSLTVFRPSTATSTSMPAVMSKATTDKSSGSGAIACKRTGRDCMCGVHPPPRGNTCGGSSPAKVRVQEWRLDPENTSAVFLLEDIQARMPRWRSLFRRAGMRIEEVIPTHDAQGEPVQLMEGPNGKLMVDLQQPMLAVYAPPSKQRVQRIRHTRTPVPIVLKGKAAKLRDSEENATDAVFMEALKSEYDRDGSLHDLRDKVKNVPHCRTKDFCLVGNVLWRTTSGRYQLVLGEDYPLREIIMREAHDSVTAGHTGRDKTLERVLRRFWWRNAHQDVEDWVASCAVCQSVKPRSSYPDGLLNPHSIPTRLWQDVGVDFVTGLPMTEQGNAAFVAFTCKLSKMVHVVPMHFGDSSAATVARIYFDTVWRLHGAPMKIVSDRDPRFQDAFWKELMRLMGVKVAMTTPYSPRSDGQAERTNRVVEDMLRSFVEDNPRKAGFDNRSDANFKVD